MERRSILLVLLVLSLWAPPVLSMGLAAADYVKQALALGAFSGAMGSALGTLMVLKFSPSDRMIDDFSPVYALASTAIAVGVSFAFSVVPAWQASRLDPMIALRYE